MSLRSRYLITLLLNNLETKMPLRSHYLIILLLNNLQSDISFMVEPSYKKRQILQKVLTNEL